MGDAAFPLEYRSVSAMSKGVYTTALSGVLLRYSSRNPQIVADRTLPETFLQGSLGFNSNVRVESSAPFVKFVFPLKRSGVYGANRVINIVVQFSKPVVVTGTPVLKLRTGKADDTTAFGYAHYTPNMTEYDVPVAIQSTDVVFAYVVQEGDNIESFHHFDADAITLPGNATILHQTVIPTVTADLALRDPTDFVPAKGQVYGQWMAKYFRKVEVLLKDLYHTNPSSLTVTVDHIGQTATLMRNNLKSHAPASDTFKLGRSYPKSRAGRHIPAMDTGIGEDFLFADSTAPNLALKAHASQSSTVSAAFKAIDDGTHPLAASDSVSETHLDRAPWWKVLLPEVTLIKTIKIFPRKPQIWVDAKLDLTIQGWDTYPRGTFTLTFSNADPSDLSAVYTTEAIAFGADAKAMQSAIEKIRALGSVSVVMNLLPICRSREVEGPSCGDNFRHGEGWVYHLTFNTVRSAQPSVALSDVLFPGQETNVTFLAVVTATADPSGSNLLVLPSNVRSYQLVSFSEVVRVGKYIPRPEVQGYGKGVTAPANSTTALGVSGVNQWLCPFWVMLFTDMPPTGLNESIAAATWFKRYETVDDVLSITLPDGHLASYLKIQREGLSVLSMAEVQIYSERMNSFKNYQGGSYVMASFMTAPYQTETLLNRAFEALPTNGRWTVKVTQDGEGDDASFGTLGEAVLITTNYAGLVDVHYQSLTGGL